MTAVEKTVSKEGPNKGRTFWTCPNSEHARCQFFEWGDGISESPLTQAPGQDRTRLGDECFKVYAIIKKNCSVKLISMSSAEKADIGAVVCF